MTRRNVVIIITTLVIVLVGLLVYSLIPKTKLLFSVAPHEVTATINGDKRQVTSGSTISVKPGTYKITVSRDQFKSYSLSITVAKGKTSEVLVALSAKTDAARELLNNQESQDIIQRFTGIQMDNYQKTVGNTYPIMKILPIQENFYYIYPCQSEKYPNDNTKLAVCIQITNDDDKPYIENYIKSKGYDLNDYEVIWINENTADQGD